MNLDILRAELERLFDLDELLALCRDILGFEPDAIGGAGAKGSFARALTEHCDREDAVTALCDAMLALKADVDPRLAAARNDTDHELARLEAGQDFGPFRILRPLGEGRLGVVYVARDGERDYRLRVLRRSVARDKGGVHSRATLARLISTIAEPGLPRGVRAGAALGLDYIAHDMVEGETLAARAGASGASRFSDIEPLARAILVALAALHAHRLAHGNLHLANVIVADASSDAPRVALVDAGSEPLYLSSRLENGMRDAARAYPFAQAPEQIAGQRPDARSDVYAFGTLLYHLLSGRAPFAGGALEALVAHWRDVPAPLSSAAPRGFVSAELEQLVHDALAKDPGERPRDARELLERIERLQRRDARSRAAGIEEGTLTRSIEAFLQQPESEGLARDLERLADLGADSQRVADAFSMAAEMLDDAEVAPTTRTGLLLRAARLYEGKRETLTAAEKAYEAALAIEPDHELALAGLAEARQHAGKFEELVEQLLQKNEQTADPAERAQTFSEIGNVYASELLDREQALVAYTQAFIEQPETARYAATLQEFAGSDKQAWNDVLASLSETLREPSLNRKARVSISLKAAEWYQRELARYDLAAACLNGVLEEDATNDAALAGLATIYQKTQEWRQLGSVLSRRAETALAPLARDLKSEAAELLEHQLNDLGGARDLYERVLSEDPGHSRAAEGLARICERSGDYRRLADLLEQRAESERGEQRYRALCKLAEILNAHLDDGEQAILTYEKVLAEHPTHQEALRGLDNVLTKRGRHDELLAVLSREVDLSTTPKQKIALLRRIAAIYDEEYLDHQRALRAREAILAWDRTNHEAIVQLMRHHRALGHWQALSALYERRLELETDPGRRVDLALEWGRLLSDQLDEPKLAVHAYEIVLEVEPRHDAALEGLARLREAMGDSEAALVAILVLADKASSPFEKSQRFMRAAALRRGRGELELAIEHYKQAVDADQDSSSARSALRDAYIERGDIALALRLFEREIDRTEGERAKARLWGTVAVLARERLGDDARAEAAARRALEFDPTELSGLTVLGDLAFSGQRFLEASKHYESVAEQSELLAEPEAKRVLLCYVEALARSDKWAKAEARIASSARLFDGDTRALERLAHLTLEHGSLDSALQRYKRLLGEFGEQLPESEKPLVEYRFGQALLRSGAFHEALAHFERSSELDPSSLLALAARAEVQQKLGNWAEALQIKERQLANAPGEQRAELLLEIGEILQERLGEKSKAAERYHAVLREKPDERRALTKLMQLHSEQHEWNELVTVVVKLAGFVEDAAQKAKYLETAAVVSALQIGDTDKALQYYEAAFGLHPSAKALDEAIEIRRGRGQHAEVERLLRRRLEVATQNDDKELLLSTFSALAELYERELGDLDNAIDAYEAAQTLDPTNRERAELLSELYATDRARYLHAAERLHAALIASDPYQAKPYRTMLRFYRELGDTDAAWCLCQTLSVLNLASDEEQQYYRHSKETWSARMSHALSDQDWLQSVLHPRTDPLLTSVFALIEPAVIESRATRPEDFGYEEGHRLDPANHPLALCRSLYYAAGALGVPLPPTYQNTNDPGGLSFLHTFEPSIVLGEAALHAAISEQAAAFIAARHLTYLRPGLYLRQLIGTTAGMKSWLFAAIKLISPQFPVAKEIEGPIEDALSALRTLLPAQTRDHLTRVVTKILQGGAALDLKRWIASVDLSADRAGFILANDLETAAEILEVSDDSAGTLGREERQLELMMFSASPGYIELRRRLGLRAHA